MYRQLSATRWESRRLTGSIPLLMNFALLLFMKIKATKGRLEIAFSSANGSFAAPRYESKRSIYPAPSIPLIVKKLQNGSFSARLRALSGRNEWQPKYISL